MIEVIKELLPDLDPERRYQWLYAGSPYGPALTWMAIDDATGAVAGITSFFRRRLLLDGHEREGALGGDGFVRPAFRRRGIGGALHQASRRDMAELGIAAMYGTPMPANQTPLAAAGAEDVALTARYARPLSATVLGLKGGPARLVDRLLDPGHSGCTLSPVVDADARVDEVWTRSRGEVRLGAVRDSTFYTWRFLRAPSGRQRAYVILHEGQPLAACALMPDEGRLAIVDLVAPRQCWPLALRAIAAYGLSLQPRPQRLEIKLTRQGARRHQLLLHGFLERETKPLNVLLPEGCTEAAAFHDASRWFFTWADSDMDC